METEEPMSDEPVQVIRDLQMVGERAETDPPSEGQIKFATELVRGHSVVEIPGKYMGAAVQLPDPIVLPEPRALADYVLAPCKHECSIRK